jgi:two-component system, sensor histidine kinase RegB
VCSRAWRATDVASARPALEQPSSSARKFAWLVRLRWFAVGSQALTVLVVGNLLHMQLSTARLYVIVGITAASNLLCTLWLRRRPVVREHVLAALMALDFVLLTALLHAAGGPSNPFTVLYLVHIALAAVVLKPAYAWLLATLSATCFGALFALPAHSGATEVHMHHSGSHGPAEMDLHLQGMWVAFAVAAFVIAYFVTRVTHDLEQQRGEAALAEARALRNEKLASLATLAAGAAHELATPLATIAVVAKELERELGRSAADSSNAADARLIREEVVRCKHILEHMATDAGESAGEAFTRISVRELLARSLEGLQEHERVELEIASEVELKVPSVVLTRALRGLVRNALQASTEKVHVRAELRSQQLAIEVSDRGTGMTPEVLASVGEPFFSTKPTGQGMGLGVFIARSLVDRLGGSFELTSKVGAGTCVRVLLPHGERVAAQ